MFSGWYYTYTNFHDNNCGFAIFGTAIPYVAVYTFSKAD